MTQIKTISAEHSGPAKAASGCDSCAIRRKAVCAQCDEGALRALDPIRYFRSYEAGQVVILAGERMDFVASVVEGVASLTQTLEDGRTQIVGLMLPADFLGRPGRERAPYTVTAASALRLCCFRRRPFEAALARNPQLGNRLLEMTLSELDTAREWLLLLGRKSAREKIASFLAMIARREAGLRGARPGGRVEFALPLTREAMADYLGLTLETVSRQISALKRDGLIRLEGARQVVAPDFAALVAESGDDADGGMLS